jgi:hypothetical protein
VAPRSLYWNERPINIIEIIDRWYGDDYRYVKVKDKDAGLRILRFDEAINEWALHHVRLSARPGVSVAKRLIWLNKT